MMDMSASHSPFLTSYFPAAVQAGQFSPSLQLSQLSRCILMKLEILPSCHLDEVGDLAILPPFCYYFPSERSSRSSDVI